MVCLVTAVVLSREPASWPAPEGFQILNHCETFTTTQGIHEARRRALSRVTTPWCFFLDSDDALPDDISDVLEECKSTGAALTYTDERVNGTICKRGPYSQDRHLRAPLLVHHLALMRTEVAQAALKAIPRGELWIEMLLYFQVAKSGAAYVPRVGYHWHRGVGMHRARGILAAQLRAAAWCARNRG